MLLGFGRSLSKYPSIMYPLAMYPMARFKLFCESMFLSIWYGVAKLPRSKQTLNVGYVNIPSPVNQRALFCPR